MKINTECILHQDEVSKDNVNAVKPQKKLLPPKALGRHPLKRPFMTDPFKINKKFRTRFDIVKVVKELLSKLYELNEPTFRFDICSEAAYHNFSLLKRFNFDLDKCITSEEKSSVVSYGSEFKNIVDLNLLFQYHRRWINLKRRLSQGSNWEFKEIGENERKLDLHEALLRGNHKSALKHEEFLSKALEKEIVKGWELIIPKERSTEIPELQISPMGVAEQLGVTSSGDFETKRRITHDLSFPGKMSEESVNSRMIEKNWEPCMFGHALLQIIHRIVHLRSLHPTKIIWMRKEDLKSAYRRMHVNGKTAIKASVQMKIKGVEYILIPLRLPFEGSICPSEFYLLSDMMTDAINDMLCCEEWNPSEVHSDYLSEIPKEIALPPSTPFGQAKDLSVVIEEGDICKADVFIDDVISVGVDKGDNLLRLKAAPCSIMHALSHKAGPNFSSIPRQNMIAENKNEAEGAAEEVKIILGWTINSRALTASLPEHKYKAWSSQVQSFTSRSTSNAKDLRSILGRLENVAIIIPMLGHFLNNIRQLEILASISNKNQRINNRSKEDFKLAQKFLDLAFKGVSLNTTTFRVPNKIYINDASEHGLGGFATHGRAWSWPIPPNLQGRAHINLLEFIAQLVSIWIDVLEGKIHPQDCILAMGDNTASMGWLRRSNFRENEEGDQEWISKQKVARKVADLILDSQATLYRQWFKGAQNFVADSLSRDGTHFANAKEHEKFLSSSIPSQVPQNFRILPVPKEISCFVTSILLLLPVQKQRLIAPKQSDLLLSNAGKASSSASESTHFISTTSPDSNKTSSCQHLHKQCKKPLSLCQIETIWWREQSTPPSHM